MEQFMWAWILSAALKAYMGHRGMRSIVWGSFAWALLFTLCIMAATATLGSTMGMVSPKLPLERDIERDTYRDIERDTYRSPFCHLFDIVALLLVSD